MPLLRNITAVFLPRLALSNYITSAFKSKMVKKTCEGNHRDYQRYLPPYALSVEKIYLQTVLSCKQKRFFGNQFNNAVTS